MSSLSFSFLPICLSSRLWSSGPFIRDHHQRAVLAELPRRGQPGLALVRFPEPDPPLPVLSRLCQDGLERLPDGLALRIELRGIIAFVQFDAQEVMPARALTEQHQLLTREPTVRKPAALCLPQVR